MNDCQIEYVRCFKFSLCKGGEIQDTKTINLSRNIVSLQVLGRCFAFFTLSDQLACENSRPSSLPARVPHPSRERRRTAVFAG